MQVKFKKLNKEAYAPEKAHKEDAGFDLKAISREFTDSYIEYNTGLAFEVPTGYVGLLFPRSSVSKKDLTLANCVGVLDSCYRGPVKFRFKVANKVSGDKSENYYEIGDKIGQIIIIPYPEIEFKEVDTLSETDRGNGGFGSSDKNN